MTCTLHVAWDDQLTGYDFGPGHPLAPGPGGADHGAGPGVRRAGRPRGVVGGRAAPPASGSSSWCTTPATSTRSRLRHGRPRFGLGTADDPVFPGMHEASALVAGATLAAARAVWTGRAAARGQHRRRAAPRHARDAPAGSACTTTRPSRSRWLLGAGRCSGSPTWTSTCTTATGCRPRSTTTRGCSRSACTSTRRPCSRAPGGQRDRRPGRGRATRSMWRCPPAPATPAGCGRSTRWCRRCCAQFRPQMLVSQHGCDTPLAGPAGQPGADHRRAAGRARRAPPAGARDRRRPLAADRRRRLRAGPGGAADLDPPAGRGGGRPVDPAALIPAQWREYTLARTGEDAPERMTDGRRAPCSPRSAVATTRVTRWIGPSWPPAARSSPATGCFPARGGLPACRPGSGPAGPAAARRAGHQWPDEARERVALFRTRLTLGTEVTDALNPAKRTRLRGEEGKVDGCRRNTAE